MQLSENDYICHRCIGDAYLQNSIRLNGIQRKCVYCKKRCKGVLISEFTTVIDEAFRANFIVGNYVSDV